MIRLLEDLAYDRAKLAAFQADPEAFVAQYDELSEYEKYLLVERDAAAIEGYIRNPVPSDENSVYAAATVVSVAAVIVVMRVPVPEGTEEPLTAKQFDTYWDRVCEHAQAQANQ